MLRIIKVSHPENDVWFFSDFHARHDKHWIYEKRGFKSSEDHYEGLITRWNQRLTNKSIAVHLGDICFGDPDGKKFAELVRRLNFRTLYLLPGNHISGFLATYKQTMEALFPDSINPDKSLAYEVYPLSYAVDGNCDKQVVFVTQYTEFSVNGRGVVACHYPIISHNHIARRSIHLSGHCHGSLPLTNKDTGEGLRLDVGPESFGRPISFTEVKEHLKNRSIDNRDHHDGSQTQQ